jgi:hypothetical protein
MPLYLNESPARKHFKDALGNANHLLVTILVGLVAVEQSLITEAPPELRTAWNPRNAIASANRSRVMALEMALVRATDALDVYIRLARRKPTLMNDQAVRQRIDGCGRSIFCKFNVIREIYLSAKPASVMAALIEVMIVWRNRQVHSDDDNEVSTESWKILRENADWIKNEFRGMEVNRLLSDFEKEGPPKFKEIASFIRASQEVVRIVDAQLLQAIDPEAFVKDLIWIRSGKATQNENERTARKKLIQGIWGRDSSDRQQRIVSFLKNCGLSETAASTTAVFSDELITAMANKNPTELTSWLRPIEVAG